MQDLIKKIVQIQERLEADSKARILAEHITMDTIRDNERLTKEIAELLNIKKSQETTISLLRKEIGRLNDEVKEMANRISTSNNSDSAGTNNPEGTPASSETAEVPS